MSSSTRPRTSAPARQPHQLPTPPPLFHEKLWPAWWLWILVLGTGGAAYVAFAPVSIGLAFAVGTVVAVGLGIVILGTTPAIVVTPTELTVGRASIERRYVGKSTAHRAESATFQRGPGLNAIAFMCLRGWIDPVVRIEVTDGRDSTPYWLASSRRPEELAALLSA